MESNGWAELRSHHFISLGGPHEVCSLTGDLACSNSYLRRQMLPASMILNYPQLIGDYDGSNFVKFFDWSSVFDEHTTAIKGISKFQHFRMSRSAPGYVFVRTGSKDPEKSMKIRDTTWQPSKNTMPPLINPPRLPLERQ